MNLVIARLIQDHKNMMQVHSCLKHEMSAFVDLERRPDLLLLLDAMEYLRSYSDGFHHPLEDRLYTRMRLNIDDPALIERLDHIELQHAWMHVLARRVQGHLEAIANDQITPLARLIDDYRAYIAMAEEHIACENRHLLPAMGQYLEAADFEQVLAEVNATEDPLHSDKKRDAYARLYNHIVTNEVAA